jgi:hypothetical protein
MRTRQTIGIIISFLLIAIILVVFTDPWSSIRRENRKIHLQDPGKVDRIVVRDRYDSTLLVKTDGAWTLAGGEPASQVAVENLLYAAGRLQISSIHSGPGDRREGEARSVIFYHGEKPLLHYEVTGRRDSFLLRPPGAGQSYSVTIPGYGGIDLDRLFSSAVNHYREHILIDLLPSEIRRIEVERRNEKPFRFTMDDSGEITCMLLEPDSILPHGSIDDLSVRLLFSYFTAVRYEEKAEGSSAETGKSVEEERWLARLYVESRDGERHTLQVYSMPGEDGRGTHMFRALVVHNDDPGVLVVKYIYLDVLMRGLSCYFASGG